MKRLSPMAILMFFLIYSAFLYSFLEFKMMLPSIELASDFRWRRYWGISMAMLLTALTWSCLVSAHIININLSDAEKIIILLLIVLLVWIGYFIMLGGEEKEPFVGIKGVKLKALKIINITNVFAILCVILMIFSSSILLLKGGRSDSDISRITKEIYLSFHSSSLLLMFGTLEVFCLYKWFSEPNGKVNSIMVESMVISAGSLFTFILILTYYPLFSARNKWLSKIIKGKKFSKKSDIDDWFATNGIEEKAGGGVINFLTIAPPLIVGLIVNID